MIQKDLRKKPDKNTSCIIHGCTLQVHFVNSKLNLFVFFSFQTSTWLLNFFNIFSDGYKVDFKVGGLWLIGYEERNGRWKRAFILRIGRFGPQSDIGLGWPMKWVEKYSYSAVNRTYGKLDPIITIGAFEFTERMFVSTELTAHRQYYNIYAKINYVRHNLFLTWIESLDR